jgi:hypothetical protein
MSVLLEYLDDYKEMRSLLMAGQVDKVSFDQLARNLAQLHAKSHRSSMSEEEFGRLQETFA